MRGKVNLRRDQPNVTVKQVIPVHRVREELTRAVSVRLKSSGLAPNVLEDLRQVVMAHPGKSGLYLEMTEPDGHNVLVQADRALAVTPSESFIDAVRKLLGDGHLVLHAVRNETSNSNGRRGGYS